MLEQPVVTNTHYIDKYKQENDWLDSSLPYSERKWEHPATPNAADCKDGSDEDSSISSFDNLCAYKKNNKYIVLNTQWVYLAFKRSLPGFRCA